MEHKFFYAVLPKYRDFFKDNELKIKEINPHVYLAMESLSSIIEIETY